MNSIGFVFKDSQEKILPKCKNVRLILASGMCDILDDGPGRKDNLRRALFSLKDDSDFKNFKRDTFPLNLDFRFGLDSLNFKWNAFFLDLNFRFSTWTGTNTLAWHLEKQTLLLAHVGNRQKEHFGSTPEGFLAFELKKNYQIIWPIWSIWSQFRIWVINTSSFQYFSIGFLISILGYLKY
ncbi:hypothetical protein RclHR1_00360030 [Rhizophagus clarus]|uniref:Uncharacterized protein n=1 Tax=Rhizophagus clarus TaxID=94130 RepID=A0A2Z6RT09_9GLOM|nr:hypothetical protein RclHR1_00360030 [Rhizophagus clarus]